MTERLGREEIDQFIRLVLPGGADPITYGDVCKIVRVALQRAHDADAAHDALAQDVARLRGDLEISQRLIDGMQATENALFGIKDRPPGSTLAIVRWLIEQREAAEQRAGGLASIVSEAIAMAADLGEGDLVDKWRAALTPPSQHGQATGVLHPGTLPPLEWDDQPPSRPQAERCKCGRYDLTGAIGQHDEKGLHQRQSCPDTPPSQPGGAAKCSCGEPSPDSIVEHRTDGPCRLRPRA